MSDLAAWLWTILVNGQPNRAYNVGSDESVSIGQLAHTVTSTLRPTLPIQIDGKPQPDKLPATYVPDITRVREELGLEVTVPSRRSHPQNRRLARLSHIPVKRSRIACVC